MSMKRIITILMIALVAVMAVTAETKEEKKARKEREKAEKAMVDSANFVMANAALQAQRVVFLADRIESRYGVSALNDNQNFIAFDERKIMIQVVPLWAGFQGINLSDNIASYRAKTGKKGDVNVSINVNGSYISSSVSISLVDKSNYARATFSPNFDSGFITMYGYIYPLEGYPEIMSALGTGFDIRLPIVE